jgi:hypothetical protein
LPGVVAASNAGVLKALAAQFGTTAANMLVEPDKVPPAQYELYCRLVVGRFRTIAELPPRQAADLMSALFTGGKPANR